MGKAGEIGGLTQTERYLSALANKSFLSLWSFNNLFREPGKELCDLLVVCHNIVIIFSDKEVKFDLDLLTNDAWARWYNRAILKSVPQLKRARNWLLNHPDRVFTDSRAQSPIHLFNSVNEPLEIHLVTVANGASRACMNYFNGGSGSLLVSSSADPKSPEIFTVGNPGKPGLFVHVFDEAHLHIMLQELDTITDFRDYLCARERLISIDGLFSAAGEEDLLAVYLKDINERGNHDFVWSPGVAIVEGQKLIIEEGAYGHYRSASPYRRKKIADRQSYIWDRLIEKFAKHYSAGTLAEVPKFLGNDGRHGGAELGLRYMALERRVQRRSHSKALLGAFDRIAERNGMRFFRAMLPETEMQGDTGFCVLLMKREFTPDGTDYENYRQFRAANLAAYTEGLLERNRHLKRVIGLATEGVRNASMTEDLIYHEPPDWTEDAIKNVNNQAENFGIFRGEMKPSAQSEIEYPETDLGLRGSFAPIPYILSSAADGLRPQNTGNRKSRRAAEARARRKP